MSTPSFLACVLLLIGLVAPASAAADAVELVARLNAVKAAAKELRGGKVQADAYLAALATAQDSIVQALGSHGVTARRVPRFDFGGLPGPAMMRNSPRAQQEDAVISSTGHLEIGRGRIADAILIEPLAQGGFVNRLAHTLKARFKVATVIEAGSLDNETASASFSGDGNYMSIPLCDALADAISYMTYHELHHLASSASAAAHPSALDGKVRGDGLLPLFKDPLYASGFTIDEMAAYPEGVHYSASLLALKDGRDVQVPYSSSEWKVVDAQVFDHQLRILSSDRHRAIVLNQLVTILEPFLNAVDATLKANPLVPASTVEARGFIGETLILTPPGSDVQVALDVMADGLLGDGTPLPNPTVSIRSAAAKLGVALPLAGPLAATGIEVLQATGNRSATCTAGSPAVLLHGDVSRAASAMLEPLPGFVKDLRALNVRLKSTMESGRLAEAEAIVAEMVTLTRALAARGGPRLKLEELRRELGF